MIILGIETSCDETAVALVKDGFKILGMSVASSLKIHIQYGGIVPEVASRKQAEYMIPVLEDAFIKASITKDVVDALAVTIGPGLMGSLLVGVDTAKVLSLVWNKPLIPVNHLVGHIYSGFLDESTETKPAFPFIALIASGGHTDLVLVKDHGDIKRIGSTRDDAVGEAFDKVARLLGLPYPGGPEIESIAKNGDPESIEFPRPMIDSKDFAFSFSGLKTSVLTYTKNNDNYVDNRNNIAASFQQAAFDVLVKKSLDAVSKYDAKSLLVTGGVAANQKLKSMFANNTPSNVSLHIPPLSLATDNATYIATAAYFLKDTLALDPTNNREDIIKLEPDPSLEVTN